MHFRHFRRSFLKLLQRLADRHEGHCARAVGHVGALWDGALIDPSRDALAGGKQKTWGILMPNNGVELYLVLLYIKEDVIYGEYEK